VAVKKEYGSEGGRNEAKYIPEKGGKLQKNATLASNADKFEGTPNQTDKVAMLGGPSGTVGGATV